MEAHFYPGLRNHRATHERLLVELDEIIGRIDQAGRRSIGNELTAALVAWFRNHVVTMDRELAGFLIRGH